MRPLVVVKAQRARKAIRNVHVISETDMRIPVRVLGCRVILFDIQPRLDQIELELIVVNVQPLGILLDAIHRISKERFERFLVMDIDVIGELAGVTLGSHILKDVLVKHRLKVGCFRIFKFAY
jgi:hypothetical protein